MRRTIQWKDIIKPCSVALVAGKRGSGKSGCGYWLPETLSSDHNLTPVVVGLPQEKKHLLPQSFVIPESLAELPENAVVLIDEAALAFHARRSMSNLNMFISGLVSLARQRNQIIILVSHVLRKLDVALVMELDAILMKEPSRMYAAFERSEIRHRIDKAKKAFLSIKGDRRQFTISSRKVTRDC